jgi:hypothetical protein
VWISFKSIECTVKKLLSQMEVESVCLPPGFKAPVLMIQRKGSYAQIPYSVGRSKEHVQLSLEAFSKIIG